MNKVYIFLNNKLVSCDTILPLAIELKNKAPSIKINFFVFDIKTYEEIKKNTTLYNLIDKIGKLDFIGWKQTRKYSLINKFLKLLHLYFIILNVLFHKNRVIHFRYLEEFPWNIIYYINKKNTILFESDCWGYEENVAKIFYDFKPNKVKSDYFKNYYSLVYFGTKWPQVIHAKNKAIEYR